MSKAVPSFSPSGFVEGGVLTDKCWTCREISSQSTLKTWGTTAEGMAARQFFKRFIYIINKQFFEVFLCLFSWTRPHQRAGFRWQVTDFGQPALPVRKGSERNGIKRSGIPFILLTCVIFSVGFY